MRTSSKGLYTLKGLEGFRGKAYQCQAGRWTWGYGSTENVKEGDEITEPDASLLLSRELIPYEHAVSTATNGCCNQNQYDALVMLAWNIGIEGMRTSSVIKAHDRGDFIAASRAFGLWNKYTNPATKQKMVSTGLTRRRAIEATLYLTPVFGEAIIEIPQAVEPPKPMSESTINRAGLVAGSTATIAAVTQTATLMNQLKDQVTELGTWVVPILLLSTIISISYMVYQRFQQREQGHV